MMLGRVGVSAVEDDDIGESRYASGSFDGRSDLLMHPILPADLRMISEQVHGVDHQALLALIARRALPFHQVTNIVGGQTGEQSAEAIAVGLIDPVVGVQPKDPFAGSPANAL